MNGTLSHARFVLKEANFLKKSGFYYKALEMIDTLLDYMDEELKAESSLKLKHKAMPQLQLKFRVHRDRARVLALLNRNEESMKAFDKAEKCIELTESNLGAESIKYAKMYYIKGLAARRVSSSKAENFFDYAIDFFAQMLETENSYYGLQIMLETATIKLRQNKEVEAQTLL